MTTNNTGLTGDDYPGLFQAADAASGRGQRSYLRASGARLLLAVLAAAAAAFTVRIGSKGIDIAAVVTALAFVGALIVDIAVLRAQPSRTWYQGRALAESAKTLTWRYAVGASPFPLSLTADDADRLFLQRIRALQGDLPQVPMVPNRSGTISDRMRRLREGALDERRSAYLSGRIHDQQRWYADKAEHHRRRASVLRRAGLALELVGVTAALAKAFGAVDIDLAGIVAAAVSGLAAWSSANQYTATATAYAVATNELSVIGDLLTRDMPEPEWSATVADAEEAISREHTMWRASHGG
ncbi:DUF4231 domain-containing protein [Amycolatopsis cihanbeyliensis]|uniref:DUF4231 domain-containing protein n=1 Tax=Amycolatopsis cihanbeyliensis TaxID=1128664 RepID=UPI001476AF63|nr:DUF4231 domain-containing protein [Amycolatopsis cihanbeyliensis]